MIFDHVIKVTPRIIFANDIPNLILIDNRIYILVPSMGKEKRKLWILMYRFPTPFQDLLAFLWALFLGTLGNPKFWNIFP